MEEKETIVMKNMDTMSIVINETASTKRTGYGSNANAIERLSNGRIIAIVMFLYCRKAAVPFLFEELDKAVDRFRIPRATIHRCT